MVHSQLVRGVIDLLVLSAVGATERYGYAIVQQLTNAGLAELNEATVYTALRRLENGSLLRSRQEPVDGRVRRYYRLSPAGAVRLEELRCAWRELVDVVAAVDGGRKAGHDG